MTHFKHTKLSALGAFCCLAVAVSALSGTASAAPARSGRGERRLWRGRLRSALEVQRSAGHEVLDRRRQRITFALCNRGDRGCLA